jgi:hypothetical protein
MSTVTISDTPFVGNDRLLVGIVLSVLTFWLFAQSVINVVPAMKSSLDISLETLTLAVSQRAVQRLFRGRQRRPGGQVWPDADDHPRAGAEYRRQRHAGGRSGTGAVPGRPGAAGAVGGLHYAGDAGAD